MKDKKPDIHYLFEPRSIAVVGASNDKSKIGYKVLHNIVAGGYAKKIYPINPRGGQIAGLPVYQSIQNIDDKIDVACIIIPAEFVFRSVQSCVEKGVKFALIITSGFSEVGNSEEENKIASYAHEHGLRILGPNIFGIYSVTASLNATFGESKVIPGNVAIVTQSGALGASMIGKTAVENMGMSAMVSVGNKADIDESDLLEHLTAQEQTKIIMMYIEGVKEGKRLFEVLNKVTSKKPVVVIKSGRYAKGAIAAASHTGSLAGSDGVFDAIMRQCGVLRAENIDEAFNWCKFLSHNPLPRGDHTVIITNGGGIGVMCADACEKYGVKLYDDIPALSKLYEDVVPEFGSKKNPVDLTGQATTAEFDSALTATLNDQETHSVIALACELAVFDGENLAPLIEKHYKRYKEKGKTIVFSFIGGEKIDECIRTYRAKGYPVFGDVYDAVSSLGSLYDYYNYLKQRAEKTVGVEIDIVRIEKVVHDALIDDRNFLLADEAQEIMKAADISMPRSRVANSLDDAIRYAEELSYPVVMKIVSKDVIHKTDAGGVALNLLNQGEVMDAYQAIIQNCKAYNPQARIKGVAISEMAKPGAEVIVGARKDHVFGPIVMFGLGGIYVEVMKDISFRAFPLSAAEIIKMIKEIKSYPLLLGIRGEEKKDIDGIVDVIMKLGTIIQKCEGISDIEINPVVAYSEGQGVKALDVRILLSTIKRKYR